MTIYHLPLSQVHCDKCTTKIKNTLAELTDFTLNSITPQFIDFNTETSLKDVFKAIESLGYQVGYSFTLPLAGLSCGKCVAKVQQAFEADHRTVQCAVTKTEIQFSGAMTSEEATKIIEDLGYQVPTENTFTLPLAGLSCGKCVAKVEASLDAQGDKIAQHQVSTTEMTVTTTLSKDDIVKIVEDLGYQVPTENTLI